MKHLFKNFLEDKRVYALNEHYYQNLFREVLNGKAKPFYNSAFKNGEKFYNANPIFSTQYGSRIVRIIQKEPSAHPRLRAYPDKFDDTDELVIVLELTDRFVPVVRSLARQWLVEMLPKEEMQTLFSESRKATAA